MHYFRKIIPFVIAIAIGLMPFHSTAFACSCVVPGRPKAELGRSTAVFSGRVTAIETGKAGFSNLKVTFDVSEVWKGTVATNLNVSTYKDSAGCGFEFRKNEDYLVYASGTERHLEVFLCSRTQSLASAASDVGQLGVGEKPAALPEAQPAVAMNGVWIAAAVGVAAFGGWAVLRKKRVSA